MNPVLFKANSTSFNTNGVGRLTPISCTVTEERNSIFELDMTVKIGCNHFEDIKQSAIITAKPSPGRRPQPFRIYYVSRPIGGKVKIKAEHLSYWLNYIPVMPFSTLNGAQNALNGFRTNAAESCPFTFWTDITSSASYSITAPESIRHYLGGVRGSIIDVFGGEYEWDEYAVKLHKSRGVLRDVTLRYGKNITDLRQEENIANTFTGVCPYWQSTEGQLVTLPEKVIHSANASNFPFQRTITKDFSDKFDNAPTEAQLRAYTQSYVGASGVGVPSVSIDVSFVDLAQTEEYKDLLSLQEVELCDTIKVEFPELGVSTIEKITKTVYDVLAERYTKIGVGDVRSSLAKTIEEQIDTVSYMPTTEQVQRDVDRATGVLNKGRSGYVLINRNSEGYANEILFLDAQSEGNLYSATNILRINQAGIGFSSNGYQGNYYQSWTLDGILSLGGVNNAYGELQILDPQGKVLCAVTKDGYTVYDDDGQTIIGQWSHSGISLKKGVIDFEWGADTVGFYADGEKIQLGDWIIDSQSYGRAILQSTDEVTGMSAETDDEEQLYLWAGYHDSDDYVFVVNRGDAYVMYNGQAYPIGASINNLNNAVAAYLRDIESGDDDDGDEEGDGDGDGEKTEGGYLEDEMPIIDDGANINPYEP